MGRLSNHFDGNVEYYKSYFERLTDEGASTCHSAGNNGAFTGCRTIRRAGRKVGESFPASGG